jgi:hypothetical protein
MSVGPIGEGAGVGASRSETLPGWRLQSNKLFEDSFAAGYEEARYRMSEWHDDLRFVHVWSMHQPQPGLPIVAIVHPKARYFGDNFHPRPRRVEVPTGNEFDEWPIRHLVAPIDSLALCKALRRFELPRYLLIVADYQEIK